MRYIWKQCFAALLTVALAFALLPASARAEDQPFLNAGGKGTQNSPYEIANPDQFKAFRDYVNEGNDCENQFFKLTEDIGLGDEEWVPIGNNSTYFKGVFDGAEHTVSGLQIVNSVSSANVGMFWYLDGTIKNLGVSGNVTGFENNGKIGGIVGQNLSGIIENCHFTGTVNATGYYSCVGGITGLNNGTISNCYFSGTAENNVAEVGGIAGKNQGTIENCYNTGVIVGNRTGGIVGYNDGSTDSAGSVINCYNTGNVSGTGEVGAIAGYNSANNTTINNCYYLTGTATKGIGENQTGSGSAPPKSATEFKTLASTLGDGWENSPFLCRPMLKSNREVPSVNGKGTANEPYEIPDLATLEAFRDYINADKMNGRGEYFKLTDDIDMSDKYGEGKKSWTPIGDRYTSTDAGIIFQGTFDGDNHVITGLYINKPEQSNGRYQGLFGQVDSLSTGNEGIIKNLTVSGTVTGYEGVGGIAGIVYDGTIENCVSNVKVEAKYRTAGGIAGSNGGTVKACVNNGDISARQNGGGLVGTNDGIVINCYNTADISCTGEVSSAGGIVGNCAVSGGNIGSIKNCYSIGHVSGQYSSGGIVGSCKSSCVIENCHWVYYPVKGLVTKGSGQVYFESYQIAKETQADISNGKVAYLLSKGEGAGEVQWGQTIGQDPYPVFNGKRVYCVTFVTEYRTVGSLFGPVATGYANSGGTVTLPAAPTLTGMSFDHWSKTQDKDGETFDDNTIITEDITVYAVGQKTFGGETAITLNAHEDYDTAPTVDLDQYMAYQSGDPVVGKFDYEIASDADGTKASLSGSTLTVSTGLKAGAYEITVTAKEKAPAFSLMSVESYGVEPVTLTVQVVISPHIWTLTSTDETTGDKTYTCDICGAKNVVEGGKYCVSGRILKSDKTTPSAGTPVALMRGDEIVAQSATDTDGRCSFPGVEPGIYDLVVDDENGTTTVLVVVTEDTPLGDIIELPENVSSKLEVKGDDTPAVVVDGLDDVAQASADLDPDSDKAVTVTMTVEAVTDGAADSNVQDAIDAIKAESASSEHEYLDLTLEKTVSAAGVTNKTTEITETKNLITVVIPFDPTGKSNIVVYRYHDSHVDILTGSHNKDDEYIEVSDNAVKVHAKNFSVYAIAYTQEGKTPPSGPFLPPLYGVVVPARTEGGRVKADRATALPGSRVTLTVKPDEGYHFGSLTVHDRNGKPMKVTDNGDGTYTFTMPYGKVTVKAAFVKCGSLSFTDLDTGAWYHDYTDYVIAHGLMQGIGGGLFAPDGAVSRAQMVLVLWNMRGKPVVNYYMTYSDVSEGVWYSEAIRWAASEGIAVGYDNGNFGPNDPVTRDQMVAMLYRYEQKQGGGYVGGDVEFTFTDKDKIGDWCREAVAWSVKSGIIVGKDGKFDPYGTARRNELAVVLTQYANLKEK